MTAALAEGRLAAEEVYVNAHRTGTTINDVIETRALHQVFGAHALNLAISSSKGVLGHALGAAGAFEAVVTALPIHHSVAPPTANFLEPDPACDLDYVPNEARTMPIDCACPIHSPLAVSTRFSLYAIRYKGDRLPAPSIQGEARPDESNNFKPRPYSNTGSQVSQFRDLAALSSKLSSRKAGIHRADARAAEM
jgi:hypothetical protein